MEGKLYLLVIYEVQNKYSDLSYCLLTNPFQCLTHKNLKDSPETFLYLFFLFQKQIYRDT